jgi:hypothetical protein
MTPKEKKPMVRTSVQLPQELLDSLNDRWPGLSQSEQIRLALERHSYVMTSRYLVGTDQIITKHPHVLAGAIGDMGYADFKIACRALPSLVEGFLKDEQHNVSEDEGEKIVEWIEEAEPVQRLHMIDAAVRQREKKEAGPRQG